MTDSLSIALAQLNPTVGAIDHNIDLIRAARAEPRRAAPTWWSRRSWRCAAIRPRTWC